MSVCCVWCLGDKPERIHKLFRARARSFTPNNTYYSGTRLIAFSHCIQFSINIAHSEHRTEPDASQFALNTQNVCNMFDSPTEKCIQRFVVVFMATRQRELRIVLILFYEYSCQMCDNETNYLLLTLAHPAIQPMEKQMIAKVLRSHLHRAAINENEEKKTNKNICILAFNFLPIVSRHLQKC